MPCCVGRAVDMASVLCATAPAVGRAMQELMSATSNPNPNPNPDPDPNPNPNPHPNQASADAHLTPPQEHARRARLSYERYLSARAARCSP